jgi:predicted Zn-dependent peptidase
MAIESFVYENGLRVLHEKSPSHLPLCTIHVFCTVGSAHETHAKVKGISHYLEHILIQLSNINHRAFEIFDKMGSNINAVTTKRYTCFYITVPEKFSTTCIEIFSNMLNDTKFNNSSTVIRKEKKVIQDENERINRHFSTQAFEFFESTLYKGCCFRDPVDHNDFQDNRPDFTETELYDWYRQYYKPGNIIISIVSRNSIDYWRNIIQNTKFIDKPILSNPTGSTTTTLLTKPERTFYDFSLDCRVKLNEMMLHTELIVGFRTVEYYSTDQYAFDLLNHILNGMSGRLFRLLRQKHNLVYSCNSVVEHSEFIGYFTVQTECSNEHVFHQNKGILYYIVKLYQDLVENGVSQKELTIAKESLKSSLLLEQESISTIGKYNGEQYLISSTKGKSVVPFLEQYNTHYKPIQLRQINHVIRNYFRLNRMIITISSSNLFHSTYVESMVKKWFIPNSRKHHHTRRKRPRSRRKQNL